MALLISALGLFFWVEGKSKVRKTFWLWVKKKTPTGTASFGLVFLLPIGFFGYPVFLTHSRCLGFLAVF